MWDLLLVLGERMSLVVTLAFIFTRTKLAKNLVKRRLTFKDRVLLSLIFGAMGIIGTYTGILMQGGAIANSRVIGVMVGGFLGGPAVGIAAGLIAGIHRFFVGGFTALACALATVVEGTVGGLVAYRVGFEKLNWRVALWAGLAAEVIQMLIILLVAKPFAQAWQLVQIIGLPMILINSVGVAIFITIIRNIFQEQEKIGALQAQKSLEIADKTLPHLRKGLSKESAAQVAGIIHERCDYGAVAITDRSQILAHVGAGADHHRTGMRELTGATQKALSSGEITLAKTKDHIGCKISNCTLGSAVVIPLMSKNEVIGALKLYHTAENSVNTIDVEFGKGLAHIFSTQLEVAALEKQACMLNKAEINALRAQINPHFLFNALNTIVSLVRTKPETARELLVELGEFFRNNLKHDQDFVSLKKELDHVKSYLAIELARFGEKIRVQFDVDEKCLNSKVPAFLLQPLVENAIKHGILPQKNGGEIFITAKRQQGLMTVTVKDNGMGISREKISSLFEKEGCTASGGGIGLINVNERLKSIYGPEHVLQVESSPGKGTLMSFSIPVKSSQGGGLDEKVAGIASSAG